MKKSVKLKVACQEERFHKCKEDLKNLFQIPPEINDKPSKKLRNNQRDIEIGQFREELEAVLKNNKDRKFIGLYNQEMGRTLHVSLL